MSIETLTFYPGKEKDMKRLLSVFTIIVLASILAAPLSAGESCDKDSGFKFGGFLKTDLIYDDTRISPGNYALYVSAFDGSDKNEIFLTARESRLAFDFWWKEGDYKTKAYLEFDFQNAGAGENKASPMLRHAFFKFGKCRWSILAGQTWDIISPLNPKTANYSVLWYQGNIGYRRPQFRVSTWTEAGNNATVTFDAGIFRNLGGKPDSLGANDSFLDFGADSGLPTFQGRIGFASTFGESNKIAIGFSGHYGKETYEGAGGQEDIISWSANADLVLVFNEQISLKGELFTGENLGQYLGGIGQRVDPMNNPLPSMGGWGMLSVKANGKLTLNAGYGFDDPDEAKWICPEETGENWALKSLNSEFFGNLFYDVTKHVTSIFEIAFMKTEHLTREYDGTIFTDTIKEYDSLRYQFALKCSF